MSAHENKAELLLDIAAAAHFFRNFADALEGGEEKTFNELGISIQASNKIKLEIKRKVDRISIKIKVKKPLLTTEDAESTSMPDSTRFANTHYHSKDDSSCKKTHICREGTIAVSISKKSGYKSLKKRLGKSFKNMKRSLLAASPPTADDLSLFLEDSAAMLDYPGYGDEYYADYTDACNTFKKSAASGDLEKMLAAFNRISELKSACHELYK